MIKHINTTKIEPTHKVPRIDYIYIDKTSEYLSVCTSASNGKIYSNRTGRFRTYSINPDRYIPVKYSDYEKWFLDGGTLSTFQKDYKNKYYVNAYSKTINFRDRYGVRILTDEVLSELSKPCVYLDIP